MTTLVWLYETGSSCAHLFSSDDSVKVAACGFELEIVCDHCGTYLQTERARDRHGKCIECLGFETDESEDP